MAQWAKGESGNPGGRPKGLGEIREIARAHTDAAINVLVGVMGDDEASPSARVAAASALLDRGWGRPAQTLDLKSQISLSDALREIAEHRQVELDSLPKLAS